MSILTPFFMPISIGFWNSGTKTMPGINYLALARDFF
jgi:hypothetical protein